jgi:hypothetical protein
MLTPTEQLSKQTESLLGLKVNYYLFDGQMKGTICQLGGHKVVNGPAFFWIGKVAGPTQPHA